ncbi:hypothetical protein PDE_00794 [Penicillium oxalicum 114-2]|uniref:Uncharacterized protein n=1 Tax=Penicillium oxalicum (strain 114-2 / CGMCC 5302) TaxID=933388 RepID=S8AJD3_PENO1|nr:hypothetical protein PDE_00794 [Penicillium oxalicum 114-2]
MPSNESLQSGLPTLPEVDLKSPAPIDSLVQDVVRGLKESGACIIRNLLDREQVGHIMQDMKQFLKTRPDCPFFAQEVKVVGGLAGKSPTFATHVACNEVWQKVLTHFLRHPYGPYWSGGKQYVSYSGVQLGSSAGLQLDPGAKAQDLHRDDTAHRTWNGEASEYQIGRDSCLTSLTACTATTSINGATRVVPGSHLWDYNRPPPPEGQGAVDALLQPGDSLFILGSVLHGHGENSSVDEERMVLGCGACCDFLRQEENQYLAHDREALQQLPSHVQRFIGYSTFEPAGGTANWKDPWQLLNPNKEYEPMPMNTVEFTPERKEKAV